MKKILILEDTSELLASLCEVVKSLGHAPTAVKNLSSAYDALDNTKYDLVILDRILPDGDSLDFAEYIAEFYYQTKILFLSQYSSDTDRISGLKKGGDDYLPKPFSRKELELKISILLHRSKIVENELLVAGPIKFNPSTFELNSISKTKILRKKEAHILTCLMRHKNSVVSREKLISYIWGAECFIPAQTTLDVYIRRIRIHLGRLSHCLITIRGAGYMLSEIK